MKKLIVMFAVAVIAIASPALAFQCPKLVKQINDTAGNRFDATAQQARIDAASAAKLHAEGKHAESVKTAQDALAKLGVK
jgi:ABC-type transporter MlaC component